MKPVVSFHWKKAQRYLAAARGRELPWQTVDLALLAPVLTLCVFGMLAVFWAGLSPQFSSPLALLRAKVASVLFGAIVGISFSRIDYHCYEDRRFQLAVSLAAIAFLVLLFFVGLEESGANLRFLVFNRTIQPTEYIKIIVVLVLSYTIAETYGKDLPDYFIGSIHSLLLSILLVLIALQPDYGVVLILLATSLSMLIVARVRARRSIFFVTLFVALGGLTFLIVCFVLAKDFYVLDRFRIFLECFLVVDCKEFQLSNGYKVIASGKLFGNHIVNAIHPHGVLPMECNDFIFCVIAEEMGFVGVALLLLVYLWFIQRGFFVAKYCRDFFGQLIAFGLTWIIGFQALLNILVATGLFPITGITLPFVSHGGNSLISAMIAVGILMNISRNTFKT